MMLSNNLSPVARFLLLTAAFVIVVAGMKQAASLLVPFLLSVFIAMLCSPALSWMRARGMPSGMAIVVIILTVVLAGLAVGLVVGGAVSDFNKDLPEYQKKLQEVTGSLTAWLGKLGFDADQLKEVINPGVAMNMAGNVVAGFSNTMANAFMILLTVIFILAEEAGFASKLVQARGGNTNALEALERFSKAVNSYMGLKTLISLGTGVLAYILLLSIGVNYAAMWAMLAFLLNFVPTVGSILAALPPVLLALVQDQLGITSAAWTAAGYLLINVIVGNVVEPRVMGKGLNLSALVVFLSLVFWGWALGPVGMLLSIPLTIMVKIALENNDTTRWIGMMLGAGEESSVDEPMALEAPKE